MKMAQVENGWYKVFSLGYEAIKLSTRAYPGGGGWELNKKYTEIWRS